MFRLGKAIVIAAMAILTLAPLASAQSKRVIIVRRYYAYPAFDPFMSDRYWYSSHTIYAPTTTGDIKLKTDMKNASVFVDGGFAGRADNLKRFSLTPGTHTVELRDNEGQTIASRTVEVLLGRTTTLDLRG